MAAPAPTKPTPIDYVRVARALWRKMQPLLPKAPAQPRRGRPPADTRAVLTGMWYVWWTGCPCKALHRDGFGVARSVLHELPARRWVVAQTVRWLVKRRSVRTRWCKTAANWLALVQLARAHIVCHLAMYG